MNSKGVNNNNIIVMLIASVLWDYSVKAHHHNKT